jgi:hypothetical protein
VNVSREQISLALFNLVKNNPSLKGMIKTFTRVPRMWTEVSESEKPQVLLFKGGPATEEFEQPQDRRISLTRYTISYNLWLYVTANAYNNSTIETFLNNFGDGLDNAMTTLISPTAEYFPGALNGQRQTLGGLVNNAWLDGGSEWSREFQDGNIVCMWRILVQTGN